MSLFGRWRCIWTMPRKTQIPEKPRYSYARQRAYKLLCELGIDRLPIDPWAIANVLPNVHVLKWTELRDNCHQADPLSIDEEGADAKTQHIRGSDDYLVVYDDRVLSPGRIRWTVAHEIGHIVLGHLVSFDATALCRGSLTEAEYYVLEREADCFAVNLLAPMTILNRIPSVKTAYDYMEMCELSEEASKNCLEELSMLKSGKRIPFPTKEEDTLFRHFFRFLNEVNGVTAPHLDYDDLVIDAKYEDYIECDYWDFIVMVIRKWKFEKELHAALEGSIALYDYDDMVIFITDAERIPFVKSCKGIILESLQKYADSCVKRIEVAEARLQA